MNPYSYQVHELAYMTFAPLRAACDAARFWARNPLNPLSKTQIGRNIAASAEMFERLTRRYGKPAFGLSRTSIDGQEIAVEEEVVWSKPFCRLLRFRRDLPAGTAQPKLLIIAPMSGHYATLLRGTVEAFLPHYDVYLTDWKDARMVPAQEHFDLDDYIDYLIEICHVLKGDGGPLYSLGVCQPAVPLIAAVALMEAANDPDVPDTMILMGGPIDTRESPTAVNVLAEKRGSKWFRANCIHSVPYPYPGFGRLVYPGFLQLSGFMAMNVDRHVDAHVEMFNHLIKGDGESGEKHRDFYDEYLAVMDLTAEFYLQTIDTVFVEHRLPKGTMVHRKQPVDLSAIHRTALMTVEGENDDISGPGQTKAAHRLCSNIPAEFKHDYVQKGVGHYGVFNGSRFRTGIVPEILAFNSKFAV
ncbi:MAG: polyhydroxyalkanoate depolymerase [Beijerinckiaceae bacterium]|jgi:poly(3-hydroxybutyrate) depolymerase